MFKINPYRPGAGLMPIYLAGREDDVENIDQVFDALKMNIPVQSIIYSGLRGVGKTVLLNVLQGIAEDKDIFCRHIEVEERKDFIAQIAACSQSFLRKVSLKENFKNLIQKPLDAIKALVISFDPNDTTFSLSVQEKELYTSTNLTQSLIEVFSSIGEVAYKTNNPICFFIDEIQYMKSEEMSSMIAALHRSNQLGYPVLMIGAGLPKIYKMLSESKSYAERLFMYKEIGTLSDAQSQKAIMEPASKYGIYYSMEAVDKIISVTKGYPFFIQQLCKIVYDNVNKEIIEEEDVIKCIDKFYKELDIGFFKVRYERCSNSEKEFIFSMVMCGELPCTISNVANNLNRTTKSISPTRGQLINKGIIYPIRYSELDFTVPEFDGFIKRCDEYNQWIKDFR